jgi:hypothetical protein
MSEEMEKKGSPLSGPVEAAIEGTIEKGEVSQADDNDLLGRRLVDTFAVCH